MQPGGRHSRMGTHNALLKIGDNCYLEVISIDPDAECPRRNRWFELDTLLPESHPRLATWVMRTNGIFDVVNAAEIELGIVEEMTRGSLEWQITIPPDGRLPLHGIAPAVIQWKDEIHPASKLAESSVSLLQLTGYHPESQRISALLDAVKFAGPLSVTEAPESGTIGLTATFQTPNGLAVLS